MITAAFFSDIKNPSSTGQHFHTYWTRIYILLNPQCAVLADILTQVIGRRLGTQGKLRLPGPQYIGWEFGSFMLCVPQGRTQLSETCWQSLFKRPSCHAGLFFPYFLHKSETNVWVLSSELERVFTLL